MENKKELYQNILALSKEISLLIELGRFDKIEPVLEKRQKLVDLTTPQDAKDEEIKALSTQINEIDKENISKITEEKSDVYNKLRNLSRNKQVLALYKIADTGAPLIDERN